MRRSAVLILLFVAAVAVVFLLLEHGGSERAASRRHEANGDASGITGVEGAGADSEGSRDASSIPGDPSARTDDDPNRVPGADLLLAGRVVRDGKGVPGATVVAQRAYPAEAPAASWTMRSFQSPPPAITSTTSQEGGRFELRIARRSRVILHATKRGSGAASLFLLMPASGDPPEVTLDLRAGSTVEGIVVDEKGEPVESADVVLDSRDWNRPIAEMATRTAETGRFSIEDVPDGSFHLRAQASGYPEVRHWVNVPSQTFVRLELRAGGTVAGTVVDGNGAAIAGARVMLSTTAWERAGMSGMATAETDGNGAYRMAVYPGAVQTVVVEHPRYGRQVAGAETFDLPTGLVESGKELKYDIRLPGGVVVRGRAVYVDPEMPAAGASIALLRMSRQWRGMSEIEFVRADDEGRFEFPYVTEGTYGLEAKGEKGARLATRYPQGNQRVTIDFFVDGETSPPEQRLELVATGGIHGRIVGIGEPDPSRRPNVYIQLGTGYMSAVVDDLCTFEFTHVPVLEDAIVQSNNPQAKSDPVRVEAGKVAEVTLDASASGMSGIVVDEAGRPVAGAHVHMSPQNQIQGQVQQSIQDRGWGGARTGSDGRFTLAPGQWAHEYWRTQKFVAFAYHQGYVVAISDTFDLPEEGGASPDLRLVLTEGGILRGRVEHAGGAPAINVPVTISPKRDPTVPVETRSQQTIYTGYDGRFEVKGLGDGIYLVSSYDALGKVEPREARAGDEDVKLVIEPALSIGGVVVTESGSPVPYAQVSILTPTANGEQRQNSQTQPNGRFRVGQLAEGTYAVEVSPTRQYGGAGMSFEKKRIEDVSAGTENLVIVVEEGKGLRGKVEDRAGRPIPGAGVIAMPLQKPQRTQPGTTGRPYQSMEAQTQPSAVANGRGEFEIKGLGNEEVELLVVANGYVPTTERAVAGGPPVVLRLDQGEVIEGKLLKADGTPAARQWLWLQPASKEVRDKLNDWQQRGGQAWNYLGGWNMSTTTTEADGGFRFSSLMAGEYLCQSQQGKDEILPVATLRTGMPSVTLRFERALTIRGRVVGPDGRPPVLQGGARINVGARREQQWLSSAIASEDGTFELRGMPPGTVTLQVWASRDFKPVTVEVAAGSDSVLITLEPNQPKPAPPGK